MPRSHGQISPVRLCPGRAGDRFREGRLLDVRAATRALPLLVHLPPTAPPGMASVLGQYRSDAGSLHPDEPGAALYPHGTVLAAGDCTMLMTWTWPDSARPPGKPAWLDGCWGQNQLANLWAAEHADR